VINQLLIEKGNSTIYSGNLIEELSFCPEVQTFDRKRKF